MVEIIGVKFRSDGRIYSFDPAGKRYNIGDYVIVTTSRGTEICEVVSGNHTVPDSQIVGQLKPVVRTASDDDVKKMKENRAKEREIFETCEKKIAEHQLEMKLVSVEIAFDGSKILFFFTADGRVDFRELVKDLAASFHTRIELRQIGVRDEAKMMGGLGFCGQPFCCSRFLSDFQPVSIKMAKEQNFSLNSAKVSGACGRLMCCLRYEHEVYEEAIRVTPPVSSIVLTSDGEGTVIETKPLAQEIRVKLTEKEKETIKVYKVSDVKILKTPKKNKNHSDDDESDVIIED